MSDTLATKGASPPANAPDFLGQQHIEVNGTGPFTYTIYYGVDPNYANGWIKLADSVSLIT